MSDISQAQSTPAHLEGGQVSGRIGMWLFLITEVLLFCGLLLLYAVYRSKFPADFHYCTGTLDISLGAINTVILLTTSLTMAIGVIHIQKKNRKTGAAFIGLTMALGFAFLVNIYLEWSAKFHQGLYPNSEILQQHTPGENIFYNLFYLVTGLHGLHVVIGIIILAVVLIGILKKAGKTGIDAKTLEMWVENSGLYWHLVTITRIFLFPLFYLIT